MSIPFSVAQAAKQKNADETTNFEACSNSLQKQLLSLRQGTVESGAAARAWGQRRAQMIKMCLRLSKHGAPGERTAL